MTKGKRVLIVDDEPSIRELYTMELGDEGYKVLPANCAQEGLDLIRQGSVDLVILDIQMPDMDGRDFLNHARELSVDLPIVISSAHPQYKQDFAVWGADAYLVKTSDLKELKSTVRDLLARKKD